MTSESNKQKISKIHDIFPDATKDHIAKILQYYDDDENQAVDALTRDGGCEALSNWAESGSLKSKNNKNKKKKKKGKKESDLVGSATASFDADDSSSIHSSGNVDAEVEKEYCGGENRNGISDSLEEMKEKVHDRIDTPEAGVSKDFPVAEQGANVSVPEDYSKCSNTEVINPTCISPVSDGSDKQKDKYKFVKEESHGKHSSRQRTNSFRRSKTASLSEESTNIHNPQNPAVPTKRGYEKCKKDLNRQTISLQRIHSQVDKGLEESTKKIRNVFNEIKKLLDKRQELIEQELAKTKEDALNLLKSRQDLAVELKRRVDRTPSLTESEWSELRSDVKQFVTERKYDDELGKTIWFHWSMDAITSIINTFGEVHPVKNVYSQRSHSAMSNAAVSQNNPEPSPSSSLANEEIGSTADKNDVANICDADDVSPPALAKKEVAPPVLRSQPSESRSRVFSNRQYQSNRGNRGGFRGNRGFGFPRGNNRNMNYRNNNYHYDNYSNDYRSHSHHDPSMYPNMNNHRNNRRGQNSNYRSGGRFRGNMGAQRQTNDSMTTKVEPNESSNVTNEKANVVNGYVNNSK